MEIRLLEKRLKALKSKTDDVKTLQSLVKEMPRETIEYRLMLYDLQFETTSATEELVLLKDIVLPVQKYREAEQASQAEKKLEILKLKLAGNQRQADAKLEAAKIAYQAESQRLDAVQQQLKNCRIVAPRDGIVVYANQSSRRAEPVSIEVGTTVREGKSL